MELINQRKRKIWLHRLCHFKFALSYSWALKGHQYWEFSISTVVQSSWVYESDKLLEKHSDSFLYIVKNCLKLKVSKITSLPDFLNLKLDMKNNHGFPEGNLSRRKSFSPLSSIIRVKSIAVIIFNIFTSSLLWDSELESLKSSL